MHLQNQNGRLEKTVIFCKKPWNHRMVGFGRDLWGSSSPTVQQDFFLPVPQRNLCSRYFLWWGYWICSNLPESSSDSAFHPHSWGKVFL